MNMNRTHSIGVMDSGVGGTSVLKTLLHMLPNENFIYYGDSKNAPYGEKSQKQVIKLTMRIFKYLRHHYNIKAFVIACNTATSSAKKYLIKKYPHFPIFGIEPALKQAVDNGSKNIVVMATPLTMKLPKYQKQLEKYAFNYNIFSIPCPGLAELIEGGRKNIPKIKSQLHTFLNPVINSDYQIDSIVLGCTHYPYIKSLILANFKDNPTIYTGYDGLARYVKKTLNQKHLLNVSHHICGTKFISSYHTLKEIDFYSDMMDGKILK